MGIDAYISVILLRLIPLSCKLLEVSSGDSHILNISPAPALKGRLIINV